MLYNIIAYSSLVRSSTMTTQHRCIMYEHSILYLLCPYRIHCIYILYYTMLNVYICINIADIVFMFNTVNTSYYVYCIANRCRV